MEAKLLQVLTSVKKVQNELKTISDDMWLNINHNDTKALEEGVNKKKILNEIITLTEKTQKELNKLFTPTTNLSDCYKAYAMVISVNGTIIPANSVPELYKKTLEFLFENHRNTLLRKIPQKTGKKRFLINTKPIHPLGNEFRCPVEFSGLYMESHESYKGAINDLKKFMNQCNLSLEIVKCESRNLSIRMRHFS